MFRLTTQPLVAGPFEVDGAGGYVSFEGRVRDNSHGRQVLHLEYEAFDEMALSEGERLVLDAKERFGVLEAQIVHRTGLLQIGDTAVLIQVASAHRREAFEACGWLIDELKVRVPIWKRETFADGTAEWVGLAEWGQSR